MKNHPAFGALVPFVACSRILAADWLKKGADAGDPQAAAELGHLLLE